MKKTFGCIHQEVIFSDFRTLIHFYIKMPNKIGTKWNWKLKIGDHWSDKRWLEWKGGIENIYEYEIIDKNIETRLGNLKMFSNKR